MTQVQTEIDRLESAKEAIATAITGKGVTVPSGTLLDGMAALIESIEAGGGSNEGKSIQCVTGTFTTTTTVGTTKTLVASIRGVGFEPKILVVMRSASKRSLSTSEFVYGFHADRINGTCRAYSGTSSTFYVASQSADNPPYFTVETNADGADISFKGSSSEKFEATTYLYMFVG